MHEPNLSTVIVGRQPPPPKLWIVAGLLAVAATLLGIYLALINRSSTTKLGIPSGSNYLPPNTLVAVTLATDRQRWQPFTQLGTPQSRAVVAQELSKWQQEFWHSQNTKFAPDIPNWLGSEVSIAYLAPLGSPTSQNPSPNLPLLLWPIKSDQTALQLLTSLKTASGQSSSKITERRYQGITLQEIAHSNNKILVTAIVGQFVLVSPSLLAIQQSIDAFQSGKNLATAPGYAAAWAAISLAQPPLAQVYINMPVVLAAQARSLAPDKLAQVNQQQGVAANINLDGSLLAGKGIAWWQPQSKAGLIPSKSSPNLSQRLPENTVMMVSGQDLAQLWTDYLPLASKNPAAPIAPEAIINNLKSATGLDLNTDILAWSKNEFLLALVPATQPQPNSLGGSLLLMFQPTDRSAAETTFSKLDRVMADRYQFKIASANIKNTDVVNWSSPINGVNATHGWLTSNLAFMSLGTPITDQFLPQSANNLNNNNQFQQVMKSDISPYSVNFLSI
jgi:hypothetical protein